MARGRQAPGPEQGPSSPAPELEVAAEDLLIERPDLGPGCATLIVAGDPVPVALADWPRRPRHVLAGKDAD
jgi:hypothetical protein